MNKWIKCTDEVPEKYQPIIFLTKDGVFCGESWDGYFLIPIPYSSDSHSYPNKDVIAWMPLPESPNE